MAKSSQIFSIFGTGNLVLSRLEAMGFASFREREMSKLDSIFLVS